MAEKQEINIEKEYLSNCNGEMKMLLNDFSGVIRSEDIIHNSKGHTADTLRELSNSLYDTSENIIKLLHVSIEFFEKVGIEFKEADEIISKEIRK